MPRTCLSFVAVALCASALLGCTPASATSFAPTEIVVSTEAPPGGTATPTLTPEELAAVSAANTYLGDKLTDLRFGGVRNIGTASQSEYRVDYKQVYQQIDVWTGDILVFVESDGRVWSSGSYYPDVAVPSVIPTIAAEAAIQVAADSIAIAGGYTIDQAAKLVIYPTGLSSDAQRSYVLAWQFVLHTQCPEGIWSSIVNAVDGTLLSRLDVMESKAPIVGPCATPLPVPTLTALATISPATSATPGAYPPPATSTQSGYPAPTNSPAVSSTGVSP